MVSFAMIKHSYKYSNRISQFFHFTTRGIDLLPLIDLLTRSIDKPAFLTLSLKSEKKYRYVYIRYRKEFCIYVNNTYFHFKRLM